MSVLHLPRVHFKGLFVTDVGTANNNNVDGDPVLDVAGVRLRDHGLTDTAFRRWMEEPLPAGIQFGTGLDKFEGRLRAGWNYYGDNSCYFQDVEVTTVQLRNGTTIDEHGADPLVGARVTLDGAVMVDVNPAGETSTQIFCDQFTLFGDRDVRFAGHPCRMFSRWLKYDRNHGLRWWSAMSAIFQCVIPFDSPAMATGGSPGFEELVAAGDGLSIRFCLYTLAYQMSIGELSRMFEDGRHPHNPAVGRVVGTIGSWHTGDPQTVSLHRYLYPTKARGCPQPGGAEVGAAAAPLGPDLYLGPAVALLDDQAGRLTLDLVTTFPERNADGTKVDCGEVFLEAGDVHIPLPPNDKKRYEATSGIVDLSLTPEQVLAIAREALRVKTSSRLGPLEEADIVLESDDRGVYLEVGSSKAVSVRALRRGHDLGSPMTITVDVHPWHGSPTDVVDVPALVVMSPDGLGSLTIQGNHPGGACIRFVAPGLVTSEVRYPFDSELDSFIEVRVLPTDSHLDSQTPTFDLVTREVLRYYLLLHPAMAEVFDLSRESVWRDQSVAVQVLARIRDEQFEWSDYMPRTRDMSRGKRALLQRWCSAIIEEASGDGRPAG